MNRPPTYDPATVDLVTRTLRAIGEATPVSPPDALVDRFADVVARPAASPLGNHPPARRALVAAAAALVVLVGVAITWVGRDADGGLRMGAHADPAAEELAASWLPDDLTDEAPLYWQPDQGLALDGAVLTSPDGTAAVLAVTVERRDGRPLLAMTLSQLAIHLGDWFGHDGPAEPSLQAVGGQGHLALGRDVGDDVVAAIGDRLEAGTALTDAALAPDGWAVRPVTLNWVPRVAASHGVAYRGDEASRRQVEVTTVAGDLPDAAALAAYLPGAERVAAASRDGWLADTPGQDTRAFVWQEAPGIVGVAASYGLSDEELLRVAGGLRPVPWQPDDNTRIVGEGETAGLQWTLRRDAVLVDGSPCLAFVVELAVDGPLCDPSNPDGAFTQLGVAAASDDTALVWGVVGPDVRYVDGNDGTSAEALPVDPADPDSPRYVVMAVPLTGSNVMFDFLAESGDVLDSTILDLAGPDL